ncbi:MAG: DUF2628 domain-containing protein [Eubacterium sp.]|nr:DUF2628 domain-containing protein [Eubacterium sp.]
MFLYENNKCPVCNKVFEEGDDVVSCPECGTPHHRECYNSLGKCANKEKHGSDFVYNRNDAKKETAETAEIQSFDQLFEEAHKTADKAVSDSTVNEAAENKNEEANAVIQPKVSLENDIDGVSPLDVKAVVSVNSERFVKRFSKKRKLGWNWGAFFFGPYYFMYRKMCMESLIFLVIPFVASAVISKVFESAMLVLKNIYTEMYAVMATYDPEKMSAFLKESTAAPENKQAWMVVLITLAVSVVLRIIAAVIADNQYRKRVVKIIKTVDEKVNLGESFSFVGPMMGEENMSQSELRKMFLAKQGGVSLLFPLALIALSFFSYMF